MTDLPDPVEDLSAYSDPRDWVFTFGAGHRAHALQSTTSPNW